MRLIDADELMRIVTVDFPFDECLDSLKGCKEKKMCAQCLIEKAPTIEAEPVKHGKWEPLWKTTDNFYCFRCSECHSELAVAEIPLDFEYCPNCGAKMDKEAVENDE